MFLIRDAATLSALISFFGAIVVWADQLALLM